MEDCVGFYKGDSASHNLKTGIIPFGTIILILVGESLWRSMIIWTPFLKALQVEFTLAFKLSLLLDG